MAKQNTTSPQSKSNIKHENAATLPLGRLNFILMAVAGFLIVIGFALMVGGGTGDASYSPTIFSSTRIVVAPLLAFLGFLLMGIAIIVKPRKTLKDTDTDNTLSAGR